MPPQERFRALTNKISQSGMYVMPFTAPWHCHLQRGMRLQSTKKLSLPAVDMAIICQQQKAVHHTGQLSSGTVNVDRAGLLM